MPTIFDDRWNIALAVTLFAFVASCGGGSSGGGNSSTTEDSSTENTENNDSSTPVLSDCQTGSLFTALPLAENDFTDLAPLGNLNPTGHTFPTKHHYFYIVNSDDEGAPDVVPVYMPGDSWITQISTTEHLSASPVYTDYSISFKPCNQYRAYFGHIQGLSSELETLLENSTADFCTSYSTGGDDYHHCGYSLEHYVSAGTQIGIAGGTVGQWALDFGARDQRQTALQWANQERWEADGDDTIYTACVSDAYEDTLRLTLEARYAYGATTRTVEPVCGTIAQDVPGTAQGVWFLSTASTDTTSPEDQHIALVHDNYNPEVGVLSIGTSISGASGRHEFSPATSGLIDRELSDITNDGLVYCFDINQPNNRLLLQMTGASTLQLEYQSSTQCSDGGFNFTGSEVSFIR